MAEKGCVGWCITKYKRNKSIPREAAALCTENVQFSGAIFPPEGAARNNLSVKVLLCKQTSVPRQYVPF